MTAQAKGSMGRVVVDWETTFATDPVSPVGQSLPFNTCEIEAKQNLIETGTMTGTRNPAQPGLGRVTVGGAMTVPMCFNSVGFWLKALFGAPTTTGTSKYTHAFKIATSQPSMVIEKGFTDITQYEKFNGCKLNTFTLNFGDDSELVASLDILGAKSTLSATPYDETVTAVALDRINQFQATLEEGGSAFADVLSGTLVISSNLDGNNFTVGAGNTRGSIPEGQYAVTGTLKVLFKDATLINKGKNATESSLKLKFTKDADTSVEFSIPEIQYDAVSPKISGPAGIVLDLSYRGFYGNDAAASVAVVTLKNTTASY